MPMRPKGPGSLITPEETLEHARESNFVMTVVGMSGSGKTHFEELFKREQAKKWDTYSVDGAIQADSQVKLGIDKILGDHLGRIEATDPERSDWHAEVCNRRIPSNLEELTSRISSSQRIPKADKDLLISGLENIHDPEALFFLTLWNNHFPDLYDQKEDQKTVAGLNPEGGKNRYLSTTGSVINLGIDTRKRIRANSTVIHILLDDQAYIEEAIAQMAGKPISFNEEHYTKWVAAQDRAEVTKWAEQHGTKKDPHPDYLPAFVEWRTQQYQRLSHATLNRSELQGVNSHEFMDMALAALFKKYSGTAKTITRAVTGKLRPLADIRKESLGYLSEQPVREAA